MRLKTIILILLLLTVISACLFSQEGTRAVIQGKSGDNWILEKGAADGVAIGLKGYFWTSKKSGDKWYSLKIARFHVAKVEDKQCQVKVEDASEGFSEMEYQWASFQVQLKPPAQRMQTAVAAQQTKKPIENGSSYELVFWESVKSSKNINDFREYLRQYPQGIFAGLARNRIEELEANARPVIGLQAGSGQANPKFCQLRSSYLTLTIPEAKNMAFDKKMFVSNWNPDGYFNHVYELLTLNGNQIVIDHATGLMWHQSGSSDFIEYGGALQWIDKLNEQGYGGFFDWRLPTLEEASSLIENSKANSGFFIDPVFSTVQKWIWTGDSFSSTASWVVDFSNGELGWPGHQYGVFVRPVRSGSQPAKQGAVTFNKSSPVIRVRSDYKKISVDQKYSLSREGVFNKNSKFKNDFELKQIGNHAVVIDHTFGLMWHQSGSRERLKYKDAVLWLEELNRIGYGGYSDWRLPTLEEAYSIFSYAAKNGELNFDPVFSNEQKYIWTGDEVSYKFCFNWGIDYTYGAVDYSRCLGRGSFVRPVREFK